MIHFFIIDSHSQRNHMDPAGRLASESLSQRQGQWIIAASRKERGYDRRSTGLYYPPTQLAEGAWTSCPARSCNGAEGTAPRCCWPIPPDRWLRGGDLT